MNKHIFSTLALFILLRLIPDTSAQSYTYTITTIAGNGIAGYSGNGGQATAAKLYRPSGIFVDSSGTIYFSDTWNQRVRKIDTTGIITLIAGTGNAGGSGVGGPATAAELNYPYQLTVDDKHNVYITDWFNNELRMVNNSGIISIVAGTGAGTFSGDGGQATAAGLNLPSGIVLDNSGNKYITDNNNNRIRMINSSGIISTIAGNGYLSGNGYPGNGGYSGDGGPATASAAELHWPSDITMDYSGNLFMSDQVNHTIRMININGTLSTAAGNGIQGYSGDGGPATAAELDNPTGMITERGGTGYLFIADMFNNRIRMVSRNGIITTIAGNGINSYCGDGGPATAAELSSPQRISVDNKGNIYFCDFGNNRVRKLTPLQSEETVVNELNNMHEDVRIYPNPNKGVFTIQMDNGQWTMNNKNTRVEIYNMLGEKVFSQLSIVNYPLSITLNQPGGLYLYRVLDEKGNVISDGKFVIEN